MPAEQIPGQVYVLCLREPERLASVSGDYPHESDGEGGFRSLPIQHYVGWTQQTDPGRRVSAHRSSSGTVTYTPGTLVDEQVTKDTGSCPTCGMSLDPRCA